MTCKDCICSEVCYYKSFNDVRNLKKRRNDVEKICKSFIHRDSVKNAPTVDAVEVVHARWVVSGCGFDTCSVCRKVYKDGYFTIGGVKPRPQFNYCPNCGAKMDGGNEGG